MNHPECVMTGAVFYDPSHVRHVAGDLHRVGDTYVLTCNTTASGNAMWEQGAAPLTDMVVSAMQGVYFERRGVIVFTKDVAVFNDHAEAHLRKWPFPSSSRSLR